MVSKSKITRKKAAPKGFRPATTVQHTSMTTSDSGPIASRTRARCKASTQQQTGIPSWRSAVTKYIGDGSIPLPKIEDIKAAITARGIPSSELIRQFGFNRGRKATEVHRFVALMSQVATIDRDPYWVHLKDTPILPQNIEDVKAAILAQGIDLIELCHMFGYTGTPGTTTFIPLVFIVAEVDRTTQRVHLKDSVVPLPTFEEIMAAIPEEGIAANELTRISGFSAVRARAELDMFIDLMFIVAKYNSVTHSVHHMKKDFTKPRGALRDRDGAKQWLANMI
jgi:hypothetical protein